MDYRDMYALFRREPEAKRFFDALPDYVQDQLRIRPNGIKNLEGLKVDANRCLLCERVLGGFEHVQDGEEAPLDPRRSRHSFRRRAGQEAEQL